MNQEKEDPKIEIPHDQLSRNKQLEQLHTNISSKDIKVCTLCGGHGKNYTYECWLCNGSGHIDKV